MADPLRKFRFSHQVYPGILVGQRTEYQRGFAVFFCPKRGAILQELNNGNKRVK